jgi:hypothetical protein
MEDFLMINPCYNCPKYREYGEYLNEVLIHRGPEYITGNCPEESGQKKSAQNEIPPAKKSHKKDSSPAQDKQPKQPVPPKPAGSKKKQTSSKKKQKKVKRSEERRVGKECRRLCRSRWSPYH